MRANAQDLSRATQNRISNGMLDRLALTEERIAAMANGVRKVAALSDPIHEIIEGKVLPNGLILQKQPRRLVLDLSAIEFMDSSGLGLLMGRLRLMQELRGVMVLENPNPRIRKILRLAGMERFFEIDGVKGERR